MVVSVFYCEGPQQEQAAEGNCSAASLTSPPWNIPLFAKVPLAVVHLYLLCKSLSLCDGLSQIRSWDDPSTTAGSVSVVLRTTFFWLF